MPSAIEQPTPNLSRFLRHAERAALLEYGAAVRANRVGLDAVGQRQYSADGEEGRRATQRPGYRGHPVEARIVLAPAQAVHG